MHNGVINVAECLVTNFGEELAQQASWMRVGVGEGTKRRLLSKFNEEESALVPTACDVAARVVALWATNVPKAMTFANRTDFPKGFPAGDAVFRPMMPYKDEVILEAHLFPDKHGHRVPMHQNYVKQKAERILAHIHNSSRKE
jgi:hypothetical protein